MPLNPDDLLPHLPYLRRHARLLTGDKTLGDEYVRLCLELVVAQPERFDDNDLREGLFKAFHACWEALNTEGQSRLNDLDDEQQRLEQHLADLAPMEQRVLLLFAVEEFDREQIAGILELSLELVDDHLEAARRSLEQKASMSVLIIEDEPMIAMELKEIIEEMGLTVADMVVREEEAIATSNAQELGLVLADIQLKGDGNGIAAARSILQNDEIPIVFVTGYPERLLTGEGLEPAFVVAKPFRKQGLKTVITQALSTYAAPDRAAEHRAKLLTKLKKLTGQDLKPSAP